MQKKSRKKKIFSHKQSDNIITIKNLQKEVEYDPMSQAFLAAPSVRRIDFPQPKTSDLLSRLRRTWAGRIYTNNLKKFFPARWIVQWIWRNGFPFYIKHLSFLFLPKEAKKWRTLVKFSDFSEKKMKQMYKLFDSTIVETPAIKVFPAKDQHLLVSPHERYKFPDIFATTVQNAMLYGGTNLIMTGNEVLCHDLYDFERDYTSEELHGRTVIVPRTKRIRWLLHDECPESIPVAASFLDACAPNYAHWITEVLPKICIFCSRKQFLSIPIIVDDGLHQNIMESLFLVAGLEREIIILPIGRGLVVDELYITSASGYVPFERRTVKMTNHSHGLFSPDALHLLCRVAKVKVKELQVGSTPQKIYVKRNSGTRRISNEPEIEQFLVRQGFFVVEPERLTFLQQVAVFANAEVIIGSSGAALANIVFCSQQTKIFICISKFSDTSYWYWQNMAKASGKVINYILGDIVENQTKGIHSDFRIDLDSFTSIFKEVL